MKVGREDLPPHFASAFLKISFFLPWLSLREPPWVPDD
jgi:hypothetical protein